MSRRAATRGIVIHRAEVWGPTEYHFVVRRDGSVDSVVPLQDRAEHALVWNATTVAVAFEGCFAAGIKALHATPTREQLDSGEALIRGLLWWYGPRWLFVRGHTELGPTATRFLEKLVTSPPEADQSCPGTRFPLDTFRSACLTPWWPDGAH